MTENKTHPPEHPQEPSRLTVEDLVRRLGSKIDPPFPKCYEDYPEWKRWALAGGLEEFAKSHNVEITFILHIMPQELHDAYLETILQDQELRNAVDADIRAKVYLSDAEAYSIMAMIEGWDEEVSESEDDLPCIRKFAVLSQKDSGD